MNVETFVLVLFSIIVCSCKNTITKINQESDTVKQQIKEHWKVVGTEPFWNIQIDSNTVLFTILNDKIDSIFFDIYDFVLIDGDTSFKFVDKNNTNAYLYITGGTKCSDGMSDKQFQYSATFTYKDLELKGCAEKNYLWKIN